MPDVTAAGVPAANQAGKSPDVMSVELGPKVTLLLVSDALVVHSTFLPGSPCAIRGQLS
jgi:hypothetical protein